MDFVVQRRNFEIAEFLLDKGLEFLHSLGLLRGQLLSKAFTLCFKAIAELNYSFNFHLPRRAGDSVLLFLRSWLHLGLSTLAFIHLFFKVSELKVKLFRCSQSFRELLFVGINQGYRGILEFYRPRFFLVNHSFENPKILLDFSLCKLDI